VTRAEAGPHRQKPYGDLVSQAERAVSGVKDAELRKVAFEKVLTDMLSIDSEESAAASTSRPRPRPSASKAPSREAKASRGGPQAHVEEMLEEGFFRKPKTIAEVKAELENRGHHIPVTSLSGPLQKLCQKKHLRRQKANGKGSKKTFAYSNW